MRNITPAETFVHIWKNALVRIRILELTSKTSGMASKSSSSFVKP